MRLNQLNKHRKKWPSCQVILSFVEKSSFRGAILFFRKSIQVCKAIIIKEEEKNKKGNIRSHIVGLNRAVCGRMVIYQFLTFRLGKTVCVYRMFPEHLHIKLQF